MHVAVTAARRWLEQAIQGQHSSADTHKWTYSLSLYHMSTQLMATPVCHTWHSWTVCADGEVGVGREDNWGHTRQGLALFLLFSVKSQIAPYLFQMSLPPISY